MMASGGLAGATLLLGSAASGAAAPMMADCSFGLGFKELRDLIVASEGSDVVGDCVTALWYDGEGNGHQTTSRGEFFA